MMDLNALDYARLDMPEVLLRLFHPRPELNPSEAHPSARDLLIPVDDHAVVAPFIRRRPLPPPSSFSTATARSWLIMTNWPPSTGARPSTFPGGLPGLWPIQRRPDGERHDAGLPGRSWPSPDNGCRKWATGAP